MKNLSNKELLAQLRRLGSCAEARKWVRAQEGSDLRAMWATCQNAEWMLWYAERTGHLTGEAEAAYEAATAPAWAAYKAATAPAWAAYEAATAPAWAAYEAATAPARAAYAAARAPALRAIITVED